MMHDLIQQHLGLLALGTIIASPLFAASPHARTMTISDLRQSANPVIQIDGSHREWKPLPYHSIKVGDSEQAQVGMAIDEENIYVSYRVIDTTPMQNRFQDPPNHFKEGDALDFMIGPWRQQPSNFPAAGDTRCLIVPFADFPVVIIYQQVAPGSPPDQAHTFSSPVRQVRFDRVSLYYDVDVAVRETPYGYMCEARIPIEWLQWDEWPDRIIGDMGVLFSNDGGIFTAQRCNLINTLADTVSDLPTEAELTPAGWGELILTAPPPHAQP